MTAEPSLALTRSEIKDAVRRWTDRLDQSHSLTIPEHLELGRLWNTVQAQPSLVQDPERSHFLDLGQREIPTMTSALKMVPGRAFALVSAEHDFTLGGVLDKRFQYQIKDP